MVALVCSKRCIAKSRAPRSWLENCGVPPLVLSSSRWKLHHRYARGGGDHCGEVLTAVQTKRRNKSGTRVAELEADVEVSLRCIACRRMLCTTAHLTPQQREQNLKMMLESVQIERRAKDKEIARLKAKLRGS